MEGEVDLDLQYCTWPESREEKEEGVGRAAQSIRCQRVWQGMAAGEGRPMLGASEEGGIEVGETRGERDGVRVPCCKSVEAGEGGAGEGGAVQDGKGGAGWRGKGGGGERRGRSVQYRR